MATVRTYMRSDGTVVTVTKNHEYMSGAGTVVSERLLAAAGNPKGPLGMPLNRPLRGPM
jgi:hypothetical protein